MDVRCVTAQCDPCRRAHRAAKSADLSPKSKIEAKSHVRGRVPGRSMRFSWGGGAPKATRMKRLAYLGIDWSQALSECMVRRRVASEKRTMAVGLRQCIRPSVESVTPGHDGYPLVLVPIMWTV